MRVALASCRQRCQDINVFFEGSTHARISASNKLQKGQVLARASNRSKRESCEAYFVAAEGGAGNSASWKTLISQRPFCLVIVTIMRPLRGGTTEPSAAFVPVMTVSASTFAICGLKKRMPLT